ncbi:unnamed protein product, partial [Rhizoctonia solani]
MTDHIPNPSVNPSDLGASSTTGLQGTVPAHNASSESISSNAPKCKRALDIPPSKADACQQKVCTCIEALKAILNAGKSVPPTLKAPNSTSSADQAPKPSSANDVYWHMAPALSHDSIPVKQIEAQIKKDKEHVVDTTQLKGFIPIFSILN